MKDILSEIIAHKQTEIELQKQTVSPEQLQEQAGVIIRENAAHRHSMKQALAASSTGIISEFKRRSPSKGWINEAARAEEIPAAGLEPVEIKEKRGWVCVICKNAAEV